MRKAIAGAVLAGSLLLAPSAQASLETLKAACGEPRSPADAPGLSYRVCDDGVPSVGGTTPNPGGDRAVEVPAAYQGVEGLPPKDPLGAAGVPGNSAGNVALDVNVTLPAGPIPPGGRPLVALMHGCCSGEKGSWEGQRITEAGERWHYNSAWFASRGYVVLTYTARGFVDTNNRGSTGETQIDSLQYEMNDLQHLAGQLADDPFFGVDPQRIVATGGSYGGGFSWLALVDPVWRSPAGREMKLAAVAPKYGWTDLVHSLLPTGAHMYDVGKLPATDGSDSGFPPPGGSPVTTGVPIRSIVAALFLSGETGLPPPGRHATFPQAVDDAFRCTQTIYPFEANPLCRALLDTVLPDFIRYRSAYYQNDFFARIASDPAYRVPVFSAGTHTDPLFPPIEHRRMAERLRSVVPDYPIQEHYGDYQHFVQNKAKEWGDLCGDDRHVCRVEDYPGGDLNARPPSLVRSGITSKLNQFIDHYARPAGNPSQPGPAFDVTATLQVCPENATGAQRADEPGPAFTAHSYAALTPGELRASFPGSQVTTNKVAGNNHAARSEPVANLVANGGRCPVETDRPERPGVAVYETPALPLEATLLGGTLASVTYNATAPNGLILAARLYDVLPNGTAVMVDRGVRRLPDGRSSGQMTFQLRGNGWRFAPGHRMRLEVMQDDEPHLKASDIPSSISLANVSLRMPLRETTYGLAGEAAAAGSDRVEPTARMRAPRLASDVSRSPRFRIAWQGSDIGTGIRAFTVQARRLDGPLRARAARRWRTIRRLGRTASTAATFSGFYGRTYQFRVRARDGAGNVSRWSYGTTVVPTGDRGGGVRYRGPWRRRAVSGAFGDRLIACGRRACSLRLRWRGGDVAVIGRVGPAAGRARITVDGRSRVIDLYARRARHRQVVFRRRLPVGRHRLVLRVLRQKRRASRGRQVAVDGFALRNRR